LLLSVPTRALTFECAFDRVLKPDEGQEVVYSHITDTVDDVLNGINATVFAYG